MNASARASWLVQRASLGETSTRHGVASGMFVSALGTTTGYLAHSRDSPVILNLLPHGFMVGLHKQF